MRRKLTYLVLAATLLATGIAVAFPGKAGSLFSSFGDPYPRIVHQVFYYVEKKYVEPERAEPRKLLEGALKALETQYPQVLVDLDADTGTAVVRVDEDSKTFDLKPAKGMSQAADVLNTVLGFVSTHLGEDVEKKDLYYFALNGALAVLDPHSNVFSPKHFKEFMIGTRGSFGGIGFVFGIRDGEMTIITPIDGTPAARGGLRSGDRILYIDGEPTINMPVDVAAGKMRGEPGTQVTLTIAREGWTEPRDLTFTREVIHVDSVESYVLRDAGLPPVLYAKVKNFQKNTTDELRKAVASAARDNPDLAGIVLDLRNNPGGLLDQAIQLSDGFMDEGTIVSTRGPERDANSRSEARKDPQISDKPVVVLVNQGSASASEIVSGALKSSRALVIGQKTFGKGSVQKLYPLTDGGALKLTVAQYLTPGDVSIQSIGIQPDVLLYPARIGPGRLRIGPPPSHVAEADLKNAFTGWGNASDKPWASLQYLEPAEEDDEDKRSFAELGRDEKLARLDTDFQVSLARRVLGRARGADREALLSAARPVIEAVRGEEDAKILDAFRALGVDWSAGPAEGEPELEVVAGPEVRLEAGQTTAFAFTVRNVGRTTAHRVWGRTASDDPLLENLDFAFGRLGPGEQRTWTAEVKTPRSAVARWDTVKLTLESREAKDAGSGERAVRIVPVPKPDYAYRYELSDENPSDPARSGDGRLEEGERALLNLRVTNRGAAPGDELVVNIRGEAKEQLYLEAARHRFEGLAPGGDVEAPMAFRVDKADEDGRIEVVVSLSDQEYGRFFGDTLKFEAGEPYETRSARIPPEIRLEGDVPLRVDRETLRLRVRVSDDEAVKDFYAYLGDKKLRYVRNADGDADLSVDLDVPLEPGANRVVLVARDDKEIQASRVLFVHRTAADAAGP